jgi:alanine racemase
MISLYDLLEACNGQLFGEPGNQLFVGLSFDPTQLQEAMFYVAAPGSETDVQAAMRQAVQNGATGLLSVAPPAFDTNGLSVVLVRDMRTALLKWTRTLLSRSNARLIVVTGTGDTRVTAEALAQALAVQAPVHYRPAVPGLGQLPSALAALGPQQGFLVVEWSADQAEDLDALEDTFTPDVLVVVGSPDESLDALVRRLSKDGLIVADDAYTPTARFATWSHRLVTVGIETFGADWLAYNVVHNIDGTGFDLRHDQHRLLGRWSHLRSSSQLLALLRAVATADHFAVPVEDALKTLKDMTPLPGRMQALPGQNGAVLMDCTAAATTEDACSALDWLAVVRADGRRTTVVLGELHAPTSEPVAAYREVGRRAVPAADLLLTDGAEAGVAARAALDSGLSSEDIVMTHSAADIVSRLQARLPLGADDVVLLLGSTPARLERVVAALMEPQAAAGRLARAGATAEFMAVSSQTRPSRVEVDLDALAFNVRRLKGMVDSNVMLTAVVKADAYGSGAVAVARTALLNGAGHLAVASLEEALELREAGISAPILVLSYTAPAAIRHAVRQNITVTVFDLGLARAYDQMAASAGGRLRVHVKVDTGMGRMGVMPADAVTLFRHLLGLHHLDVEGIFTHFAVADEDPVYTAEQAATFKSVLKPLRAAGIAPRYIHACNSAGTLAFPEYHFNMVRVGIAMHGVSPSDSVPVPADFKPVMRWKTFVAQVKTLPDGHTVGYGRSYTCEGEQRLAVIPVGYADGFRRGPANWGRVLVRGQYAPVVGRVSMEKTSILVSHIPDVAIGDEVVLLGEQGDLRITADDVARQWGTIGYEVLCDILPRVPRR